MGYIAFQLVILLGLLSLGIYIIFTDETMKSKVVQIEDINNVNEINFNLHEEIKFPDVAYIQCDCSGCARYTAQEDKENENDNNIIVWEDF